MDKVIRQCPQTTTFLKRKESRSGIEPRSFHLPAQSLTARPNRLATEPSNWDHSTSVSGWGRSEPNNPKWLKGFEPLAFHCVTFRRTINTTPQKPAGRTFVTPLYLPPPPLQKIQVSHIFKSANKQTNKQTNRLTKTNEQKQTNNQSTRQRRLLAKRLTEQDVKKADKGKSIGLNSVL